MAHACEPDSKYPLSPVRFRPLPSIFQATFFVTHTATILAKRFEPARVMHMEDIMNFADAARENGKWTRTENDAVALNSTGEALLDLFGTIGALREAEETRINRLFAEAYRENPLLAVKIAFYGRDARGGLGERRTFRALMRYMAEHHPEALRPNLDLVGLYGRFDDLYALVGTPLEADMWAAMKRQFEEDRAALAAENGAVSLLAKWIKTADSSSAETRRLGIRTALELGYRVYEFKRLVRAMRRRLGVIEALMSAGRWGEIRYSAVPSRAMLLYRTAFLRHDEERYNAFIDRAARGEERIHADTLFPYDLVEKIWPEHWQAPQEDKAVEAQWRQLPNYVALGANALVIADTSGSMSGRPMATSVGLAVYFAERNTGAYHNMWMSFSRNPHIHLLKGETLAQKIASLNMDDWDQNTNLRAAFDKVLDIAIKHHVPPEEMPKSLIVISDMEIDHCGDRDWTFHEQMTARFGELGYELPNVIFWNVNSRRDVFHSDGKRRGVQLVSGQSAAVFRQVMDCVGLTPVEAMLKVLNAERYAAIGVEV